MKLRRSPIYKGWYVVFKDEYTAYKWVWLFSKILRRPLDCFGGYYNAFYLGGHKVPR